ncbi:hypothetical protein F5X99DRAFT_428788 [Biscogniauxia marginata]|nr:hypothetical protein F5X99DRAFT_428788 [Biscogniauxia marginata]
MVTKTTKQGDQTITRWLYPQCFQKLLDNQSPEGGFGENKAEVDAILNTMAALLAITKLKASPTISGVATMPDLPTRISKGCAYLNRKLKNWDVHSTIHVGFEILIPTLLGLLRKEGIGLEFPGAKILTEMNARKLSTFTEEIIYSPKQTTLLHSLEAFIGKIDIDRTAHHLRHGAMMASPSSTAAYLMNSSTWSEAAETYLRFVVETNNGGVPSAFPIIVFETTWVLSTLLESGFTRDGAGITGFAPGVLPDADDTAKSIITLSLLNRPTTCEDMIKEFESQTHFKTYNNESTASFSANCNVLNAIVRSASASRYLPQVLKSLNYLYQTWYEGKISDKWNLEIQYSMMLLAEALIRVV